MERVSFWGNSLGQLRSLPLEARSAIAWAIRELETDPSATPVSVSRDIRTEPMRGEAGLFRIQILLSREPPGFRAIYYVHQDKVYFIRFRRRDPVTYRGLHKDLSRLLHDLENDRSL